MLQLPSVSAGVLQKRSPPDAPIEKEIVEANDYLGLVRKAALTSSESGIDGHSEYLGEKAIKWLERAQASVYRDANLISKIQDYYALKMARSNSRKAYLRARQKGVYWTELLDAQRDPQLVELSEGVPSRYMQDVVRCQQEVANLQSQFAPMSVQNEAIGKMNDAYATYCMCSAANVGQASRMAKKELDTYATMIMHRELSCNADAELEELDVATKAIYWAWLLRWIRQHDGSRGMKRSREGD